MMKTWLVVPLVALASSPAAVLAQGDPEKGFESLFNGQDLEGWVETPGFSVDDGVLLTSGAGAGDLFTEEEYANFVLRLDYQLSTVGNSGVFLRAEPDRVADTGFEVQLLAPWTPYRDDLHCTGSLYGHVPVSSRPDESPEVWHAMEIVLDRDTVIVSVDGKVATWARTGEIDSLREKNGVGRVGLQGNHSEPDEWVRFRNVRIKNLDLDVDYVLRGLRRTDPQIRRTAHASAVRLGAAAVPGLCRLVASPEPVGPSVAREALFAIVSQASAPDSPAASRSAILRMLEEEIDRAESPEIRGYLTWLGGLLGPRP